MCDLCHLQDADNNWQFDIFALADATPGHTLSILTLHVFKQSGLVKDFCLDESKLQTYLRRVEKGYNPDVPYHNRSILSQPPQSLLPRLRHCSPSMI